MRLLAKISLSKRDAEAASRLGGRLRELGLEVSSTTPSGVVLRADARELERLFHARIVVSAEGAHFASEPRFVELQGYAIENVYFPARPDFFAA